jgi:tetratricopeptide (TPR) repeat protein
MKVKSFIPFFALLCSLQFAIFAQTTEVLINQAKEAIEKQDYPTAQKILDKVILSKPKNDVAYAQRARVFVRQSKYDLALSDAEKSLSLNPNNVEALNVRGVVMREAKKDANAAIADFNKAMSIDPKYYFAVFNRGLTYGVIGKTTEAIADFTKAIEILPNNPTPFYSRGVAYERQEKYNEAIADFSKVISLNEKSADAYAHRAKCYVFQLKKETDPQIPLAQADAKKALELDPKQSTALAVRGFFKYFAKDYEGAIADFEESLKISPNVKWVQGELDRAVKKSPAAQARIKAAIKTKALADLVEAKKKLEADIFNYQHYLAIDEIFSKADEFGNDFMAKKYWESLIAQNPKNICAIRFLGEYKYGNWYMNLVNFLDDGLRQYDGKNGAECAAQIAFRIGREYSSTLQFDLALNYFEKAKSIKPDLKNLQGNIDAAIEQRNARNTEVESAKTPSKPKSEIGKVSSNNAPSVVTSEVQAAYERMHNQVESLADQANKKVEEFNKNQLIYESLGWRRRKQDEIDRIRIKATDLIRKFMTDYKGKLSQEMIDHLNEDLRKLSWQPNQ